MLLLLFLLNLIMVSSTLTASKKAGEPLIISDIKKGSMAHRYFIGTSVIFLCKDCMFRFGGVFCATLKRLFSISFCSGVFLLLFCFLFLNLYPYYSSLFLCVL